MVQIIPASQKKSIGERLTQGIGTGLEIGSQLYEQHQKKQQLQEENEAAKRLGIDLSGIHDPKMRQEALGYALQGQNKSLDYIQKLTANRSIINDLEEKRGLPRGSLAAYESDPKMAEQVSRSPKKTQASQPIDEDQLNKIEAVRSKEGFDDLDEVGQYRALTRAGVSKENAEAESKLRGEKLKREQQSFENAYKAQESFINDTTKSYKAFETETKPRLLQMQNIPDENLVGPTASAFLETLGIPLGALDDPSSELYNKLSLDLLKGLPETYGNRILKVEVDNFLKTIPSLLNSPDGRRMIASNMLKLGELKEVYYNEMRRQQMDSLDNSKPLPRDFQQRVFDQVKPQIDRLNNEFVKLSEIKSVPEGTVPFFNPSGDIEFVPKEHAQWAQENGGKRIW